MKLQTLSRWLNLGPFASLVVLLMSVALLGCEAVRPRPLTFQLEQVSARHRPAFDALLAALERRDHREAEAVLGGLLARLEKEAHSGDSALALEVGWQLDAARRFGNILGGRQRVEALELVLEVKESDGVLALVLNIKSHWPGALLVRPGSTILEREGLFLSQDGKMTTLGATEVLRGFTGFELPPLGRVEVVLAPYQAPALGGALAERDGFAVRLGSGSIVEEGATYPAEQWSVARGMRVNLAPFLPSGALTPEPLLELLKQPKAGMPALVERTVRILPKDYSAAMRGMAALVNRATPEIFELYQPLLAWFCQHRPQPSSMEAWRQHLHPVEEPF